MRCPARKLHTRCYCKLLFVATVLLGSAMVVSAEISTAWTIGEKRILVIRIDFSDVPEEPITAAAALGLMNNTVRPYFEEISFGKTTLVTTVSDRVYRMPKTAAGYALADNQPQLQADARAAATADYSVNAYDRVIVVCPWIGPSRVPGSSFISGGYAGVSGNVWVHGFFVFNVVAHELAHTFGVAHAGLWKVNDGNPVSASGSRDEYGDPFDLMGSGTNHPNPRFKNELGWLPDTAVTNVKKSGTYRVYRFDDRTASLQQSLALRIFRDGVRSYWIGYRQGFPTNESLTNGAYVTLGYYGSGWGTLLLDLTSPGTNAADAALAIGSTWVDAAFGISLRPVSRGGTPPAQYIDVEVTLQPRPASFVSAWGYVEVNGLTNVPMGLTGVRAVANGKVHGLALKTDGSLAAWGSNSRGQTTLPAGLKDVVSIAAGGDVSAAIQTDGTVIVWGDNTSGQSSVPAGLSGVRQVALGLGHVVALKTDGTVVTWGSNRPNLPANLTNVIAVTASSSSSAGVALRSDGSIVQWHGAAVPSTGIINAVAVAAGAVHMLALRADGSVVAWGANSRGQTSVPVGLSDVIAIAAGDYHSAALRSDGSIICWGDEGNIYRQSQPPPDLPPALALVAAGGDTVALIGAANSPRISVQPQSSAMSVGGNVTLSVQVSGGTTTAFQWRKNGIPISGAIGSTLAFDGVSLFDGGAYDVIVTAGSETVTSRTALVTVLAPISITTQPQAQTAGLGRSVTLTVAAFGGGPLLYQWRKSGTNIPGATNATLTIINVQPGDAGSYTVTVSNIVGTVTSNAATLTVNVAPTISTQPASQTVNAGTTATFTVGATGTPAPGYQWRKDGVAITGATSATLTLTNVAPTAAGSYTVVVTNAAGPITSAAAVLTVNVLPTITTAPGNLAVTAGQNASFTVVATGTPAPGYQWRKDGVNISGATGATLTLTNVVPTTAGNYTVVVTNAAGSVTSAAGTLTVAFARLVNLSILTSLATAGDTFTMGYVVGGSGTSGAKPLVIRAAGPSLGALGVSGTLDDPKIEFFAGPVKTSENDNWGGSPTIANAMSAVGAFAYTWPASRDAAAALAVGSGDNSVRVSAVGNGTGAVIAEIYDATPSVSFTSTTPRLVNVSVIKEVGAGFTLGFYVGGSGTRNVLVRAIGPTLNTAFGVPGAVSDPQLTLYSGQTAMTANDNWGGGSTLSSAFSSVGAFVLPATSRDAAAVASLGPGSYTVQVSGVGGATGTILVEIYELP